MSRGGGGEDPPLTQTQNSTDSLPVNDQQQAKNDILYSPSDKGPFICYIESTDKVGFPIGKNNNIKIARDIFNLKLTDILKITNKGLNRIAVQFTNCFAANNFVKNNSLIDKGYKIFIPFNFVTSKGIARRVDLDLSEEELLKHCSTKDKIKILNVRRMNRKIVNEDKTVTYVPTGTVLFTFQGLNIPKYINFYYLEFNVSIYVAPVTQCFKCLRYGHTRNNCKGRERCFNCAGNIHNSEDEPCITRCFFCKDEHKSTDKRCPEQVRQKNIKSLMAFENITFFEANAMVKRNYTASNDYVYNPNDFPSLRKGKDLLFTPKNSESSFSPSERRTQHFRNNATKRSFQQALSVPESGKKRVVQQGYDRQAHEAALYFPNSRPQPSSQCSPQLGSPSRPLNLEKTSTPSNSACSQSVLDDQNIDLKSVINYLRTTSNLNKNICRDILMSEGVQGYMDLDAPSDD